jgi:hypothetical protein
MTEFGATKAEIIEAIHAGANRADVARFEGAVWRLFDRVNAMPQRVSPELIAKLNALASRLTEQGEYEAVDLIDTVVARVTAMPERELLREALEALQLIANATHPRFRTEDDIDLLYANEKAFGDCINIARAAADKIRAALEHQP